jgi:hypothetical protein
VSKQQILFLFIPNTKGSVPAGTLPFVYLDLAVGQVYVFCLESALTSVSVFYKIVRMTIKDTWQGHNDSIHMFYRFRQPFVF